jgi:hypothetical protein
VPEQTNSAPTTGDATLNAFARQPLSAPRPFKPKTGAKLMYGLHRALEPNFVWRKVAKTLESSPVLYKAFTWMEQKTKSSLFGCRMCAQCALPTTAYACPQSCPKQLRNGPCGGAMPDGGCEVFPEMPCVWVTAYERADEAGHLHDLRRLVRPIDHRLWGQSSWVNYWLDRDDDLWSETDAIDSPQPTLTELHGSATAESHTS